MRSGFVRPWLLGSLLTVGLASAQETPPIDGAPAGAEVPEDARRVEARTLAHEGDKAFTIGRCDKAIPLWEQANERFYAPTILFRIARCQALMGNVVKATATLEAIVQRPAEPGEPAAFSDARRQASTELPNLRARIARLRVEVDVRGLDVRPTVLIDMKPVTRGVREVAVDPGEHQIRVEARDQLWEQLVVVEEGNLKTIRVALGESQPPAPARTQRTVGFVIGGIGLAALAAGAYFGASASTLSSELDGVCGADRKACPPERQGDIDSLKTNALVADFALGGGAALFTAGAIVVLTEKPPKVEEPRIEFFPVGLGGGVRASF